MSSVVAVVPCASYDPEAVDRAVEAGLRLTDAFSSFSKEERILLKPNLLSAAVPEKAITTHPAVFSSVMRSFLKNGYANLSYGDSPGNPVTTPVKAADVSGLKAAAAELHVPEGDFVSPVTVTFEAGSRAKHFTFAKAAAEADAIVNICKMKTHALERITGAVKNMYGCVLGANKAVGHLHYPDSEVFAEMLCDIHRALKPRLHIMDAVTAMEGNGPSSGTPRHMGLLLFSKDPVALDAIFCRLICLDPKQVPTCTAGQRSGIGTLDMDGIEIVTPEGRISPEELEQKFGCRDFDVYRGSLKKSLLKKFIPLLPFLQERPAADPSRCIGCGLCEKACPVESKAVHAGHGKKAVYDYKKCIRCYCCQEMCPEKAIYVKRNAFSGRKEK